MSEFHREEYRGRYVTMTSSLTFFFIISIAALTSNLCNASCSSNCETSVKSSKFAISVHSAIEAARSASSVVSQLGSFRNDFHLQNAVEDCVELLDDAVDHLYASIGADRGGANCGGSSSPCAAISAALDNHETCMEGFDLVTDISVKSRVGAALNPLQQMMTQLLAMARPTRPSFDSTRPGDSKMKLFKFGTAKEVANVTVAPDGSGDYKTIMDAVNAAPNKSVDRFVIFIKRGVYHEYVKIQKYKQNLVMIGEGQDKTIITGNRSNSSGYKTFHTATFVVGGCGFMARDITIENAAGPEGGQAVAMRSNADKLVFYRCTFRGYQDTLYPRSGRQFFRECNIKGTVDFIFGDATAVFQLCLILARKPQHGQSITFTAQGRAVACSDSGFSFHMCRFLAEEELDSTPTFLGRPWRNHSRTVVMESYLGEFVSREGWLDWYRRSELDTIYYGEYENIGPGANVSGRVKWPGFHVIKESEAMGFTVRKFIDGDRWLPSTGVAYVSGLEPL